MLRTVFAIAALVAAVVDALTCTSCEFQPMPPHNSQCNDTCEGDVCFIVVNKFFNATINAGCIRLHDDDVFTDKAICQRTSWDNRCACDSSDQCNDPQANLGDYTFTEDEILPSYQMLPQVEPPSRTVKPIDPMTFSEFPVPMQQPVNSNNVDEGQTLEVHSSLGINNSTSDARSAQGQQPDDMTMTKTVGLQVGNGTDANETDRDDDDDNNSGFTRGWGSVEMANVTTYRGRSQSGIDANSSEPLTSSATNNATDDDPNTASTFSWTMAGVLTVTVLLV